LIDQGRIVMLCLVTDRRRLCPGTLSFAAIRERLTAQVTRAVDAGVDLVLVRERDLAAVDLATLVGDLVRLSRSTDTRIVVNDRVDVALVAGADGVHLRGDSVTADVVRRITRPGFWWVAPCTAWRRRWRLARWTISLREQYFPPRPQPGALSLASMALPRLFASSRARFRHRRCDDRSSG